MFKYEDKTYLVHGMHAINGAELADIEGAVMHTKFMHDFGNRVDERPHPDITWMGFIGDTFNLRTSFLAVPPMFVLLVLAIVADSLTTRRAGSASTRTRASTRPCAS